MRRWARRLLYDPLRRPGPQRILRSRGVRGAAIWVCRRWEFRYKPYVWDLCGLTLNDPIVPPRVRCADCIEGITICASSPRDELLHTLYVNRLYQPDVLVALRSLLRSGDTFWDVGANYGFMSLYVSRMFRNSVSTVAFEPSPVVLPYLQQNIAQNGATAQIEPLALSDRGGSATFYYSPVESWNGTLFADFAQHHQLPEAATVQISTIDEAVTRLPVPQVIKIDVEGAESKTIEGGARFLAEHRPALICEYNVDSLAAAGTSHDAYLSTFRDLGYTISVIEAGRFGWPRWDQRREVHSAADLPPLCNIVLTADNATRAETARVK